MRFLKHRPIFKISLVVLLVLVIFSIAVLFFTVFAIPGNSKTPSEEEDTVIPQIPDMDDSVHLTSIISDDGYMKITLYNEPVPANSEDPWGYYYMHIWIDWLKTPICRMTDTLEVYAPQFTPASSEEQYSVMTYMTTSLSGKKTEHCVEQGNKFGEWDLPDSTPLQRVSDIRIYVRVKFYIFLPELYQVLPTSVTYTHHKSLSREDISTYFLMAPSIEYIPEVTRHTNKEE